MLKKFLKSLIPALVLSVVFAGCSSPQSQDSSSKSIPKSNPNADAALSLNKKFPLIDLKKIMSSSAGVTREKYPNADYVLLDEYEYAGYNPDGTFETLDESFIKVMTEKGRRELSSRSVGFNVLYEEIDVQALEIIKPDSRVIPVNVKEQSQEMVSSGQMGMNIYDPNQKVLSINIPGLEIGDTIRFALREKVVKTRVPGTWSGYYGMEGDCPILDYTVEISAPDELPLVHKVIRDKVEGTVKEEVSASGGRKTYKWFIHNVPQIFPEPNMPDYNSVIQRLLVSTASDWKLLSKWYWNLCLPRLEKVTPEMKAKVRELTQGPLDDRKKIESIFYFVSQKIRYMGITTEKEAPGYEPHDVNTTFEKKYGVCRDKAALLVAMLREAGFKAYPVLIMAGTKKDPDVPNPYFNHAIACVEDKDGNYILMDPTDENTKDLLPAYLCDKSYLVAKPEGEGLRTSPIIPADDNLMKIDTKASVNASGIMIVDTEIKFDGINDNSFRGYFAQLNPEKRAKVFESIVKSILPSATLLEVNLRPEKMEDMSIPLSVRIKYLSDDVMTEGSGSTILELPWIGAKVGMVNYIIGQTGLKKRKYPFVTGLACGTVEKMEVNLENDSEFSAELPDYTNMDNNLFQWKRGISMNGRTLNCEGAMKLKVVEFSPEQYLELKNFLKTMEIDGKKKPILDAADPFSSKTAKVSEMDEIMLLNDSTEYEITGEGALKVSSVIKKKILSYAGKKNNSELKLSYNPVWDDVKLEYARVTLPDGTVKEISPQEINMMDQGWVSSAPRYPAGKILVASLPGVDVNSVIEYKVVHELKNRPFTSVFEFFKDFSPVKEKTTTIRYPDGMKHFMKEFNTEGAGVETKKGKDSYAWSVKDAPSLKKEGNMPPLQFFVPCALFSNGDWAKYCSSVKKTFVKAAEAQPKTAEKALELAKSAKDRSETIRKIRDFVAVTIAGAGPGFCELPMECISPSDRTLSDAYGNGADNAVLLYSMLKAVGIESEFVLASGMPPMDIFLKNLALCPTFGAFDSVIVKIKGEDIYLNDTNQYSVLGSTAHDGFLGLFLDSAEIREIKAAEGKSDKGEVKLDIKIDEKGDAMVTREVKYYGNAYAAFNQQFSEITPEDKNRYFQEACAQFSQSATPTEELFVDYKNYPGIQRISVKIKTFATIDGSNMYFYTSNPLRLFGGNPPDKRETPYYIGGKSRSRTMKTITVPGKNVVIFPQTRKYILNTLFEGVESTPATFGINSTSSASDGKTIFTMTYDSSIDPCIVPADQMKEMLFISDSLQNPETETFLIKMKK